MHKGQAGGLQIPSFGWQAGGAVGSVSPPPSRAAAAVEQRWVCSVWETGCDLAGQDLQVWVGGVARLGAAHSLPAFFCLDLASCRGVRVQTLNPKPQTLKRLAGMAVQHGARILHCASTKTSMQRRGRSAQETVPSLARSTSQMLCTHAHSPGKCSPESTLTLQGVRPDQEARQACMLEVSMACWEHVSGLCALHARSHS